MTWSELEKQQRVAKEPARKSEIDELRALAGRNLQDASLEGLSPDGCFSFAYNCPYTRYHRHPRLWLSRVPHPFQGWGTDRSPSNARSGFVVCRVPHPLQGWGTESMIRQCPVAYVVTMSPAMSIL